MVPHLTNEARQRVVARWQRRLEDKSAQPQFNSLTEALLKSGGVRVIKEPKRR